MKKLLLLIVLTYGPAASQTDRGIVTGRIRSTDGTAAAGVRVAAMPVAESNLPAAAPVLASIGQTDSSGSYRLENIPPGRYYITAGYVDSPMYFPGVTTTAGATVVAVTAGSPVVGIDFTLPRGVNLKVSGRVTGVPIPDTPLIRRVVLLPRGPGSLILQAQYNPDGSFEFSNVPPGTYSVSPFLASASPKETVIVVVADRDVTGVEVVMVSTVAVTSQEGLEVAWSLDGTWAGIVGNEKTSAIYASRGTGLGRAVGVEIDFTGKIQREILGASGTVLRLAHLTQSGGIAFTSHGAWSSRRDVRALDEKGNVLWSYPPPDPAVPIAIDDAWPIDLNGDKLDEVIVGFNGGTGLHVLDSKGKLLWQSTGLGNVWHVSAGDVRGDGTVQVVTTSATGKVHAFNADGTGRKDLDPGIYGNMIRVGRISAADKAATILVAGTTASNQNVATLVALSGEGTQKWSLDLPSKTPGSVYAAYLATGKPWMGVGMSGGQIYVVDVARGAIIASIDGQGQTPEVAWLNSSDGSAPLLVVSARTKLTAYRIKTN